MIISGDGEGMEKCTLPEAIGQKEIIMVPLVEMQHLPYFKMLITFKIAMLFLGMIPRIYKHWNYVCVRIVIIPSFVMYINKRVHVHSGILCKRIRCFYICTNMERSLSEKIKVQSTICINSESHLYKKIYTHTLYTYVTYMEYVLYILTHLHMCINITCTSYM